MEPSGGGYHLRVLIGATTPLDLPDASQNSLTKPFVHSTSSAGLQPFFPTHKLFLWFHNSHNIERKNSKLLTLRTLETSKSSLIVSSSRNKVRSSLKPPTFQTFRAHLLPQKTWKIVSTCAEQIGHSVSIAIFRFARFALTRSHPRHNFQTKLFTLEGSLRFQRTFHHSMLPEGPEVLAKVEEESIATL